MSVLFIQIKLKYANNYENIIKRTIIDYRKP